MNGSMCNPQHNNRKLKQKVLHGLFIQRHIIFSFWILTFTVETFHSRAATHVSSSAYKMCERRILHSKVHKSVVALYQDLYTLATVTMVFNHRHRSWSSWSSFGWTTFSAMIKNYVCASPTPITAGPFQKSFLSSTHTILANHHLLAQCHQRLPQTGCCAVPEPPGWWARRDVCCVSHTPEEDEGTKQSARHQQMINVKTIQCKVTINVTRNLWTLTVILQLCWKFSTRQYWVQTVLLHTCLLHLNWQCRLNSHVQ